MVTKVLTKTGVLIRSQGTMYKAVVQTVLLYRSKGWVLTGVMLNLSEGFPQ